MDKDTVRAQVVEKIAAQFGKTPAEVQDDDHLAKGYGAKSHDIIRLSASIQGALGVKINYSQTRKANTVGEWVDMVDALVNK